MYSVTGRIRAIKQPRGGYIKRGQFKIDVLEDGIKLNAEENISASLVGMAVDYMTRFLMGTSKEEAFKISLEGAKVAKETTNAFKLLMRIEGLDFESITNACKLVGYDVCYRAGMNSYKPVKEILPDIKTVENIVTMIKRSKDFWDKYGPIVKDGFTFEGGYTSVIAVGDGDYLTNDTLWDFKVLRNEINSKHTLQLLVYYIMGRHSVYKEFDNIKKLGIYNPRLNKVYLLDICNIAQEVIDEVSRDVIGYGLSAEETQKILNIGEINDDKNPIVIKRHLVPGKQPFSALQKGSQLTAGKGGKLSYGVGDRVRHVKFGEGTVLEIKEGGRDYEVTVQFDSAGVRKMFAMFAKLVKVS